MATIKSYTDISQSKKLAEILPLESADMMYHSVENEYGTGAFVAISKVITNGFRNDDFYIDDIPCWSLVALLDILPNDSDVVKDKADTENEKYMCTVGIADDIISTFGNNPVDACYEIILKLHELKML
jgi:hypothetical protein